jgi:exonuclease 3'-5' domain-containing protein 1
LVLGKLAFITASKDGKTLKSIFENPNISKYLWDVWNDTDALWALYYVGLAGVTDIQLLENTSRTGNKTYVCRLDKSIQFDLKLGFIEINRWIRTKKEVVSLMAANVFASWLMDAKIVQYCTNDVIHLPDLYTLYLKHIQGNWLVRVK